MRGLPRGGDQTISNPNFHVSDARRLYSKNRRVGARMLRSLWVLMTVLVLAACSQAYENREKQSNEIESGKLSGEALAMAYLKRGYTFQRDKQFERALGDYNQAVTSAPQMPLAYSTRAYLLMGLGRFDEALADAAQVIALSPASDTHGHLLRGDILAAKHDYSGAVAAYDEALGRDPKSWLGYGARGAALAELGEEDRALADLDRAVELYRPTPGKATFRDCRRFGAQTTPQCESQELETIDIPSTLAMIRVHRSRGMIFFKRGDYARAAPDLKQGGYAGDTAVYAALADFAVGNCKDGDYSLDLNEGFNKVDRESVIAAHRDFIAKAPCADEVLSD